ncbi:MAG: ABC transporter permease [Candidatus Methanoplasma sp.]|jgi:ABC-2 type transport system permease protein|nr:ABC transporter permease [Candidatus Methanoplasma sp.]
MSHLFNIVKKEMRELVTVGSMASVLIMVIVFSSIGTFAGEQTKGLSEPSKIGFVNGDPGGEWSERTARILEDIYSGEYGMSAEEARKDWIVALDAPYGDTGGILAEMRAKGLESALGIGPGYSDKLSSREQAPISEYYVFGGGGALGSAGSSLARLMVESISRSISKEVASGAFGGEGSEFVVSPIKIGSSHTYLNDRVIDGATPLDISMSVMNQTLMMPMAIMFVMIMIGGIVISSMGNEKENKTLETLLTLPVRRSSIVSGKILAAAVMGLVFGLLYMVGMVFYMNGLTGMGGSASPAAYGLSLDLADWILLGATVFLAIFCALGLCMILGAFAKNYKTAQTLTMPISVLAVVPALVSMFFDFGSLPMAAQVPLFLLPFTHPMTAMNNLYFGNEGFVLAGVAYLALFAAISIAATVRIYNSDILLTGLGQTKLARSLSKWRRG